MKVEEVVGVVEKLLGSKSRIEVPFSSEDLAPIYAELSKARVRLELSNCGISAAFHKDIKTISFMRIESLGAPSPVPGVRAKSHQHSYVHPEIAADITAALGDEASHVLWFKGPTGTGKTVLAHHLAEDLGFELFQLNCHSGMGPESFFGENTVEVDVDSKQNHIVFKVGTVVKAMQAGLDADGNEVGKPGLLFIDEAGAMPTNIAIALNRLLESDDPRRTVTLEADGGRVIRSHSKFRIILAANTAGRGATNMAESSYTAQMDALDISLLNRVSMTFLFGYDQKVEEHILMEKVDDKTASDILRYKKAIRDNLRSGRISTPFSTRTVVRIADAYRVFGNLSSAIYYTVFEQLLPEEKPIYNEIAVAQLNVDILKKFVHSGIDYM